jgi:hypothetical protein
MRTELICGVALGLGVSLYAILAFDGDETHYRLWYYTPAAIMAGAIIADRIRMRAPSPGGILIDIALAAICLSRPLFGWPAASGHAAFSIYVLLTASSNVSRLLACVLGLITIYAKIWLWNWDSSLWPGLGIGLIAGLLYGFSKRRGRQPG